MKPHATLFQRFHQRPTSAEPEAQNDLDTITCRLQSIARRDPIRGAPIFGKTRSYTSPTNRLATAQT